MKIVGILQNQWVRDPAKVRAAIARAQDPEAFRRRFTKYALFAGCKTGRVLQRTFGADLCNAITWEEASREIAGKAAGVFPADLAHIRRVIELEAPEVVVAFGRIACDALATLRIDHIAAPHPASRGADTLPRLRSAYLELCRRAQLPAA